MDQNGLTTGMEWMIDARGCVGELLCRLPLVQRFCETVVSELSLHVVGSPQWHQFPSPGGVTGLYLLTESHLACHTFPELGLMTLNLYCCRPRQEFPWQEALRDAFGAGEVQVTRVARGGLPDPKSRIGATVAAGINAELQAGLNADPHAAYPGTAMLSRNAGGH